MAEDPNSPKCCAVTGASGYVGGHVARHLAGAGWSVVRLGRHAGEESVGFRLGEPIAPEALRGCRALVHCAYDFAPLGWSELHKINVQGTVKLFESARQAGVHRMVLISTISAFEGCRSLYGRAKLEMEAMAVALGACAIRPGLVYGPGAGGMFGRLVDQAKGAIIIPIPAGGKQLQYLVHHDDLAAAVHAAIEKEAAPKAPVTVAHDQPWPLREIIVAICYAHNRRPLVLPIPWRIAWMGLRAAEFARVPIALRSDNLVSLIYQNPSPKLNAQHELGVHCRSFNASLCLRACQTEYAEPPD